MRWLVLLFVVLPLIEIYVMVKVGGVIGAWSTVGLVVAAAVAGTILIRIQGFVTWRRVSAALAQGQLPAVELMEGVVTFAGGVLLVIPGFITDVVGLLCLMPPVRRAVVLWLLRHALSVRPPRDGGPPRQGTRTIEGDYRREEERLP